MKRQIYKQTKAFMGALAASWLALTPVWADDTEIFFADTNAANVWPNVLFIIDTSGSMNKTVYDASGNSTGKDRLEHVQDAFINVLTNLNNMNVGIMRFSNPGGPILYPVADIDADVNSIGSTQVVSRVSKDEDDAAEILATGFTGVNGSHLYLTEFLIGVTTFNDFISSENHDAEEQVDNGAMSRSSSDLDFRGGGVPASSRKYVGLRFNGSTVPQGATITNAYITLTAQSGGNGDAAEFLVYGEPIDTGSFGSGADSISSRSDTAATVNWTIAGTLNDGQKVSTPDLSSIVQEIVNDPGFAPGTSQDDMTFVFEPTGSGTGEKEFYTYNSAPSQAERAQLVIEYYTSVTAPIAAQTLTGLKFRNLDLPRGVTVTDAYIEFTAASTASGNYDFRVYAEDTGTPADLQNNLADLSSRTPTSGTVSWAGSDPVAAGATFRTPNLASLVQTVAARGDWCGGNDMVFGILGTTGLRKAIAHDTDPSLSPRLVINYDYSSIPVGTSCLRKSIVSTVSDKKDDAEERGTSVSLNGNVLNLESGNNIGLRFPNVDIPQNATILSSHIEFTERETQDTGNMTMTISAENTGDAAAFTGVDGTVDGRTFLGSPVTWAVNQDWFQDEVHNSPDLSALVEDVVKHGSWTTGNAMMFKVESSGSRDRRAYSFNSSPGQAPRLVVSYESDGSGGSTRKVRDELIAVVNGLSHNGWTPVQDTLYEASQYYAGKSVLHGAKRGGPNDNGPHDYTRVSHNASMVPGTFNVNYPAGCTPGNLGSSACENQTITGVGGDATYVSPIDNYCQKTSHIVLLTDGYANRDHSKSEIQSFIGKTSCYDGGTSDGGECVQDLVEFINKNDQSPLKQDQHIVTHTIGFQFASQWLKDVADKGNGEFILAGNANDLASKIGDLFVDMLKVDNTFVAPVAAVNQFNRLNHLNNIYFAVFRPDEYPRWAGNVKKYGLGTNNEVLNKAGQPAVDNTTGFFFNDKNSLDLWDAGTDPNAPGNAVEKGGAASSLPAYASRNIYTHHSNSTTAKLSDSSNHLATSRIGAGGLTQAMFNATALSSAEFTELVEWTRGRDTDVGGSVDRYSFGDPLHSRPVAVTYNIDPNNPDVHVFVGTNTGSLQAIDGATGAETFAFFPEATLPLQLTLKDNRSTQPHGYGIDGNIAPWVRDHGADGIDPSDPKDFVHLFFGMRRGGSNYYSLDVTDPADPYYNWKVEGGSGDFSEMGQSWATPIPGKIRVDNLGTVETKDVLFIAGGYDPAKDAYTTRQTDSSGRAIYIVDAVTGNRIWSGSIHASGASGNGYNKQFADMLYSIPATLTVADVNSDGIDDLMIVGDTGGQVWRFDIANGSTPVNLVSGGVIADLGVASGANTEERNRRFYHAPDVALVERDGDKELAITIGSGFRPSPLSKITEDRFYMLRQTSVFGAPASYTKLTESDLYDATDNRVGDGVDAAGNTVNTDTEKNNLKAKQGWYINLHDASMPGQKVLSTPLTFRDRVVFITYTPATTVVDCKAVAGISRVFYVNVEDATPLKDWSNTGDDCSGANCTEADREYRIKTPSIVDEPVFICTEQGCDVFTGAEKPPIDRLVGDRIVKTYWRKDNG